VELLRTSGNRTMRTYTNTQERLAQLNKDADTRSVLDCIDRPIRPLIVEMNRIGIMTRFSCCGYSYDGEEEPKSHAENPNILILSPVSSEIINEILRLPPGLWSEKTLEVYKQPSVEIFTTFLEVVRSQNWFIQIMPNKTEWGIVYDKWKTVMTWNRCDNLHEAIHDYEAKLFAIVALTGALKKLPTYKERMTLIDGNISRKKYFGEEWLVEPKQPVMLDFSKVEV